MKRLTRLPILIWCCCFLFAPGRADAHAPDQSYVYLSIYKDAIKGYFEITSDDLNKALDLGLPAKLTIDDLNPHIPVIKQYILDRASFSANGVNYAINFKDVEILAVEEETISADYALLNFDLEGVEEIPELIDVEYSLMFDKDRKHRGWLIMLYNWKAGVLQNGTVASNIFGPGSTEQQLDLTNNSVWRGFWALLKLGVWHIWIGLDHILFIVALILPSVVRRRPDENTNNAKGWKWVPVDNFKEAFFYILKIVTFFTIAHSLTLALASLGIVDLPSNIVEGVIALSIGLAALHNITPIFKQKEWVIAFAFGLFHGFGFAGVLGEKGLSGDFMIYSLLGFNLGVEIGQVLIICMIFPVLFLARKQPWYPKFITWGSVFLIFLSLYWAIERFFGVDFRLLGRVRAALGI